MQYPLPWFCAIFLCIIVLFVSDGAAVNDVAEVLGVCRKVDVVFFYGPPYAVSWTSVI